MIATGMDVSVLIYVAIGLLVAFRDEGGDPDAPDGVEIARQLLIAVLWPVVLAARAWRR